MPYEAPSTHDGKFLIFYVHQMVHLVVVKAIGRVQHYSVVHRPLVLLFSAVKS